MLALRPHRTTSGRIPFHDWLEGLRDQMGVARVRARLNRVRLGNLGDFRFAGDGVIELRIHAGPGYRIYAALNGNEVILLCGGDKASQSRDIVRAKALWQDHQKRS